MAHIKEHRLDPNTRLRFRPVVPEDKSRFASAFAQMSDESRYYRCFAYRKTLSASELDNLCNADGNRQVGIVVVSVDEYGRENDSVGSASFVRFDVESDTAELAFLIVDTWQRRHVGSLLLPHLLEIAHAQGVRSMRCMLLPENRKAHRLLRHVSQKSGWTITFDEEGALLDGTNAGTAYSVSSTLDPAANDSASVRYGT